MAPSLDSTSNRLPYQSNIDFTNVESKNIQQPDLISTLEKRPPEKILTKEQLQKKTDNLANLFISKSSKYAQVNFLYKGNYNGKKLDSDSQKLLLVVKDLSRYKSLGLFDFFKIRSAMNRQFRHLSFFRMLFLYYGFVWWIPPLYIKRVVNKILATSREELKDGKNLPALASIIIETANRSLSNYNNAVNEFRDDRTNPLGKRDDFLKERLKHPTLLGYASVDKLYSDFAKAASQEKMRPPFRPLSSTVRKIQLLKFRVFKKVPKVFLLPLQAVTLTAGTIPFIIARVLEIAPNLIIKIFQKRKIASFVPTVLEDVLKGVSSAGFSHAINCFLCDILNDAMVELDKDPHLKSTKDPQNIVTQSLSDDIKEFSNLLFHLISNEPYKSKEDLRRVQQNGLDGQSKIEKTLKLLSSKIAKLLDKEVIEYLVTEKTLHPNIIRLFNFLCQSEKFEEYLGNLIELLNTIYDDVPDPLSPEGERLKNAQDEKHSRKEFLVTTLIEKGITLAIDDGINEALGELSKSQKRDLIFSYRKVKEITQDKLPALEQDARNLLSSCNVLIDSFSPINSKSQAKEDIELAKEDLKNLFIIIQNILIKENGPIKKEMQKHLKDFMVNEKILSDSLSNIDTMHDEIEQLKSIRKELKKFKRLINSKYRNVEGIKTQLDNLQNLKSNSKFDKIIDKYNFISDQFDKIRTHENYISTFKKILSNSFFKNSLLLEFCKAQKAYLNSPKSHSKERRLKDLNQKMLDLINNLKPIANDIDIAEMIDCIRKISMSADTKKLNTIYSNAKVLFEEKLSKHTSLLKDENEILTTKCLDKCKSTIIKQENEFSQLFQNTHQDLMDLAQGFNDTISNLKEVVKDIDKKKPWNINNLWNIQEYNGSTKWQAMAVPATAALGLLAGYPISGVFGALGWIATIWKRPVRSVLTKNAAAPLANAYYKSADRLITNEALCSEFILSYMKTFTNYVNKKSKN